MSQLGYWVCIECGAAAKAAITKRHFFEEQDRMYAMVSDDFAFPFKAYAREACD